MTMNEYDNINIIFMDMEIGITEQVVHNFDDSYTVFLNTRYSHATLQKAFDHALEHINNGDFEKVDAQLIEAQAHGLLPGPAPEPVPDPAEVERKRRWEERRKSYHEYFEREHKRALRQLRRYEKKAEKMTLWEWNELQIRIHDEHMADPDWKG